MSRTWQALPLSVLNSPMVMQNGTLPWFFCHQKLLLSWKFRWWTQSETSISNKRVNQGLVWLYLFPSIHSNIKHIVIFFKLHCLSHTISYRLWNRGIQHRKDNPVHVQETIYLAIIWEIVCCMFKSVSKSSGACEAVTVTLPPDFAWPRESSGNSCLS